MAKQTTESGDEQNLRLEVEKLCTSLHGVEDSGVADMEDLRQISEVIEKIKDKISLSVPDVDGGKKKDDDDDLLPLSKRKELADVLPLVKAALKQRMASGGANRRAADDKDRPSAAAGCNPLLFKARASSQQQQSTKEDEDTGGAGGGALSLKLLLRLAKNVLEPEQYYEWTTSYVDEERIYGWEKDADKVMDSLVARPDDAWERGDPMFRAAGIAGIHGSGKTALAKKVFVHDKAKDNFAIRLWVCVGPPDSEDRFNLLYRMLDNLGLDTGKVEDDIVANAKVVREAIKKEERIIHGDDAEVNKLRAEAVKLLADQAAGQSQPAAETAVKKENEEEKTPATDQAAAGGKQQAEEIENPVDRMYKELLKKKVENSDAVKRSKIGVLLYILHVTLSKTSYLIVFDDIRVYGDDGWYSNLTLPPPPEDEWGDRLAYGLPKGGKHKAAVLVTCRKEDDAKSMVRTGRVFRPPKLEGDDAWKLLRREYDQAKKKPQEEEEKDGKANKAAAGAGEDDDLRIKDLQQMKKEIVDKCLGLPVAIIEAARGFAALEPLPDKDNKNNQPAMKDEEADAKPAAGNKSAAEDDHQTNKTVMSSNMDDDHDTN